MASIDEAGNKVANPVYPFQVVMRPSASVAGLIPAQNPTNDAYNVLNVLTTIPSGTELWTVWAAAKPDPSAPVFTQIGSIVLASQATQSLYGDQVLFFGHQAWEDDVAAGSVGESWTTTCTDESACDSCNSNAATCVFA